MPIGCEVDVLRRNEDGSSFRTWCRVVSHITSSFGSSVVIEVKEENGDKTFRMQKYQLSLKRLEAESDGNWIRNAPAPTAPQPSRPAKQIKKDSVPSRAARNAPAGEERVGSNFPLLAGELRLAVQPYSQGSCPQHVLGKACRVRWKHDQSSGAASLCVLPPGSEVELPHQGLSTLLDSPLVEVQPDSTELGSILHQLRMVSRPLPNATTYAKGCRLPMVRRIRQQLVEQQYLKTAAAIDVARYDEQMHRAVGALQKFHGLDVTHRVGPLELELLGVQTHEELCDTRLVTLSAKLTKATSSTSSSRLHLILSLHLEEKAFDFDRQVANGSWDKGSIEDAQQGDLPRCASQLESRRILGFFLRRMLVTLTTLEVSPPTPALRLQPPVP